MTKLFAMDCKNPSVSDPSIEDKIKILHLMEALGIDTVNIGLPGAGPRAYADVKHWRAKSDGRD